MPTVEFVGRDRGLAAQARSQQAEARKLDEQYKSAARAMDKLSREIKQGFEAARPAAEQYRQRVRMISEAHRAEKITRQEANFAIRQAREEFRNAGNEGAGAFGRITKAAEAFIGPLTAALSLQQGITRAVRIEEEIRQRMLDVTEKAEFDIAQLAQVADKIDTLPKLTQRVEEIAKTGFGDIPQASQLVFALKSAEEFRNASFFTELQRSGAVRDAATLAEVAVGIKDAIKEEGTTLKDVVNAGFGISKVTRVPTEALIEAAATPAAVGGQLGFTKEGVLSAVAIAGRQVSVSEARTQIQGLFKELQEIKDADLTKIADPTKRAALQRIQQEGGITSNLVDTIENLRDADLSTKEIASLFTRIEGRLGFLALRDALEDRDGKSGLRTAVELGRQAVAEDRALDISEQIRGIPQLLGGQAVRGTRGRADVRAFRMGGIGQVLAAAREELVSEADERSGFAGFIQRTTNVLDAFDQMTTRMATPLDRRGAEALALRQLVRDEGDRLPGQLLMEIRDVLRLQNELSQQQADEINRLIDNARPAPAVSVQGGPE